MLAKRIIPCLDIRDGRVVKGVQFKNHEDVGGILELSNKYKEADELVFYDITASTEGRVVDKTWVEKVAQTINIPFCVAGGIKSIDQAKKILNNGADKVSINTPALTNPKLIEQLAHEFGSQAIVIGIDSFAIDKDYYVFSHTGKESTQKNTGLKTKDWIQTVQNLGAGEVVINCMNQDGLRKGYDISQLQYLQTDCDIPIVASGGAGKKEDFLDVFLKTNVTGALAASIFHKQKLDISELKNFLLKNNVSTREVKNYVF